MFKDRSDAGRQLAAALLGYRDEQPVVLALPRGGVIVAAEIAEALDAPLDLVLVRKIGVPVQPELAMGAIAASGGAPIIVRNESVIRYAAISEAEFESVCAQERAEIARRREHYLGGHAPIAVENRVAIVVDDGVATGATTRAALRSVRARKPRKLVLAVPVGPAETIATLRSEVDDLICLDIREDFGALGFFYADFRQVSDAEVIAALARFRDKG